MSAYTQIAPAADLPIAPEDLAALRAALAGPAYAPGEDGYEQARAGHSLTDQPAPDLVVVAEGERDIVAAVDFARGRGLPVGVRATGHNFGFAWPGGVMINTSRMRGVTVDPERRAARAEAGATWRQVIDAAAPHGLAPLSGSSSGVGVVGYTLSGGFGWMLRRHGAAVDSVTAAEIVTADGQLRRVEAGSAPDLFWAIRGGGGNFGVVTALEFRLYPVRQLYGGAIFFPVERAPQVLAAYAELCARAPEELTTALALLRLPPLPELPPMLRGRAVAVVRGAYLGAAEAGAALLQPLRAIGDALLDTFQIMPFADSDLIASDPTEPSASRRTTAMLRDLGPRTRAALLDLAGPAAADAPTLIELRHLGGAMARVNPDSAAFSQRQAPFLIQALDVVAGPTTDARARARIDAAQEALRPLSTGGVLPNWLGEGDFGPERARAGFSPGHYERLARIKAAYDPENMFRLNANIAPRRTR